MKSLVAGIVLIIIIGIGGFIYRNVEERTGGPAHQVACTMEAKICPDGSSVGRQGPNCEFAACPARVAFNENEISFVLPAGYSADVSPSDNMTVIAKYGKPAGTETHLISVEQLGVSLNGKIEDDIVRNTVLEPSDMTATSISQFKKVLIGGHTFYAIVIERFEGVVHSRYYLPVTTASGGQNLYAFDVVERNVTNWSDSGLEVNNLPEHKALQQMLGTLKTTP